MLIDSQHQESTYRVSERKHGYGSHVHLLDDPYHQLLLSKFSEAQTQQPQLGEIAKSLSRFLCVQAINELFKRTTQTVQTRMAASHPEGAFEISLPRESRKAVVVDLMRAGIVPSQICYETLHDVLPAENIRQDHILLNRATNEKGQVVGVKMSGHKIGGTFQNSLVFLPDPMGATGSSLTGVIDLLKGREKTAGVAPLFVALHFIVTPEYLKAVEPYAKELQVFALRLDRGLSSPQVLKKMPGEDWKNEKGLNERDYIVPGAGGIGEVLNNSFEE